MICQAYAKINLTLEILGKRDDGYHELRSVMRRIAIHDTLILEEAHDIHITCDAPGLTGPQNLAYRAAVRLKQATAYTSGAIIAIKKAIPIAAGLGGGSSDGAAALVGLNALWHTGLSRDALATLAADLGSDLPFFLWGGMALVEGRGERVRSLYSLPACQVLLVRPPIEVSTAAVYGHITPDGFSNGTTSERLMALPPDTTPEHWLLCNDLQAVTCRLFPLVQEVLGFLALCGATQWQMCGSGPTCFALFTDDHEATRAAERARARGWDAWITEFV